ncbi:MAG: hypothetical protein E7241_00055 [Lachnospiraceae bacterium]|nr:hypothetical protein [Lachnospiraceae bacterium]
MKRNKTAKILDFKSMKTLKTETGSRIADNDIAWTEEEYAEAFAWALDLQRLNNWHSEPINLLFDEGDVEETEEQGCILSLFIDRKSNRAILRRDWPEDMCLKYSKLMNFKDLEEKMPVGTKKMLQNGLNLYHKDGAKYFKALYLTHKKEERK